MSDKKVIIIDETNDEANELTQEQIEELERNERLKKASKKSIFNTASWPFMLSKILNVICIFGILFSMLIQNGVVFTVFFFIMIISFIVNYLFFK